jgi:hypothetical protein
MKSRRMRTGNVARMGRRGMQIEFGEKGRREETTRKTSDIGGSVILKWMRWYGLD